MASNDLIIVIPGITGSTLARDGTDIWSSKPMTLLSALATLGSNIRKLQLPDDIGDQAPDDQICARALVSHLHFVPGLWSPIHGYEKLVGRLQAVCARTTGNQRQFGHLNPVLFPYDWRLSNRYNGRQLKASAEKALAQWRECAPQNQDAKIVFVCHSMGGLIARWYISREGGASLTRKMITLGTPYRGAIKALSVLADGPMPKLGRFGEKLHPVVRSFPSVHQLLPSYACVDPGNGDLRYLSDQVDSVLSTSARRDAALFYRELEDAETADCRTAERRHAIVGVRQPTNTSAAPTANGRYLFSDLLGHLDLAGDGTVSAASGPKGVALDDNSIHRIADRHGHLQCNSAALDEIESVVTSEPIMVKAGLHEELSITAPEVLAAGEPLAASISSRTGRRSILVTIADEHGTLIAEQMKVLRDGVIDYHSPPLPPGGYALKAHEVNDKTGGVNLPFLVWPD